jgi:cysteine-rich CPXCG protein
MSDEGVYLCDWCGEEIVVPLDVSAGERQEYVEDCPVCCRPNVVVVEVSEDGEMNIWARRE